MGRWRIGLLKEDKIIILDLKENYEVMETMKTPKPSNQQKMHFRGNVLWDG